MNNSYNFRWNADAATLGKLKNYLSAISDKAGASYIPVQDRVAVFDVDGTLVSETDPHYIVALLWLHTVLEDDSWTPSPENRKLAESFQNSLQHGTPFECEDYGQLLQVEEERYLGMTAEEYACYVKSWLRTQPSRFFEPMVEVLKLLRSYQFTVFAVSASDREFMRCLLSDALDLPPHAIIGSDVSYTIKEGKPVHGTFLKECDGEEKIVAIQREIGQQPVLAFGNSSGDYPMFRFVLHDNPYPAEVFCLTPDGRNKVCEQEGWNIISMSGEWNK